MGASIVGLVEGRNVEGIPKVNKVLDVPSRCLQFMPFITEISSEKCMDFRLYFEKCAKCALFYGYNQGCCQDRNGNQADAPSPLFLFPYRQKSINFVQGITTGFFTNPYSQGLYKTTL